MTLTLRASVSRIPQLVIGRPEAKPKEAQCRFAQDHAGNGNGGRGDQVRHKSRDKVPSDDASAFGPHQLRRQNIVFLTQRQKLGAHGTGKPGPVEHAQE